MTVRKPSHSLRGAPTLFLFVIAFVVAVVPIASTYAHLPSLQGGAANRTWIPLAAFALMALAAVIPDA